MSQNSIWFKGFVFSCVSCFLLFTNFYMLLSAMPLAIKEDLNVSAKDMGLVVSIYLLGVVLLRPFSGVLADRFGKRKVSVLSLLAFAICSFLYFGINGLVPLLVIRLFHGVFHAISTTGHAAMTIDMIPAEKKGEGIGYYGLSMSLSMVLGPSLGLYLLDNHSYPVLIIVAGVFALISWFFTLLIPDVVRPVEQVKESLTFSHFIEKASIPVCLSALAFSFSYSSLISFIAIYTKEINMTEAGVYFFMIFAFSILISRPMVGKLLDTRGPSFLIIPALIFFALGVFLLSIASSIWMILAIAFFMGIAYGAIFPSFQTITVRLSPANRSGVATATFFLFYDMGFALGAFVLAAVASSYGYCLMYQVVSGTALFSLFLYYMVYHKKNE